MRRSPEERIFEGGPDELGEAERGLYEIIVPEKRGRAIRLDNFVGIYGKETVEADEKRVAEREGQFQRKENENPPLRARRQRGELFEAVVNIGIEAGWLGKKTKTVVPSRYDDIFAGVDGIVEFNEGRKKQHIALAVDITKSEEELWKKFADIKSSIENGRLSRIKYLPNKSREEIRFIPKVIIGADQNAISEIIDLLLRLRRMEAEIGREKGAGREVPQYLNTGIDRVRGAVERHSLQYKILLEIKKQLECFRDYAHKIGQEEARKSYQGVLEIIDGIFEEKGAREEWSDIENDEKSAEKDGVCRAIITKAKHIG